MDKKIFVERETYEKNGKQYFTYFIKGVVRGIEARVQLMPPDFTGYTVLDIVFGNENKAELVVTPYEIRTKKQAKSFRATPMAYVLLTKTAKFTNARFSRSNHRTEHCSICLSDK